MAEFSCKDIYGNNVTQFVFNDDGTVSGIVKTGTTTTDPNTNPTETTYQNVPKSQTKSAYSKGNDTIPSPISQECCNALNFIWESSTNTCYWSQTCDTAPDFKITLGAKGNEGAFFHVEDDEICQLEVKFKYLFQFDCDSLRTCIQENQTVAGEAGDIRAKLNTINQDIIDINNTIDILNEQLFDTQKAWELVITDTNTQIVQKEAEIQKYQDNVTNLESSVSVAKKEEQISAYQIEIQNQKTKEEIATSELLLLEQTLKNQQNNFDNDIAIIESTIEKYKEELTSKNNELEVIKNEVESLSSNSVREVPDCLSIFKSLNVCVTLDKLVPREDPIQLSGQTSYETVSTLENIYEGQLFLVEDIIEFFDGNCNTGIYVTGDSKCMQQLEQCIIYNLSGDCDVFSACTLNSDWLEHSFTITDFDTLSGITNEYIKLGFLVKDCLCDFNILIDRVEINKICTEVDGENVYITRCPQFELDRVCDNKKSWVATESTQKREYFLSHRETDYNINHHKLAINTKEVDLEISPATAIETDVWCYVKDNQSILDCSTGTTSVSINTDVDFEALLTAYTYSCDGGYTSACTLTSVWGIDVELDCKNIYSNPNFFSGTTLSGVPTQNDYVLELSGIASSLGLEFTTGTTEVIFTNNVDCTGSTYLNKNLKVNLSLDITTNCNEQKQFQNGVNFDFQDGTPYNFN